MSWKNVCRLSFECLQGFTFLPFLLVIVYLISSLRMYHFLSMNTIYIVLYNTTWSAINNLITSFIFESIYLICNFTSYQWFKIIYIKRLKHKIHKLSKFCMYIYEHVRNHHTNIHWFSHRSYICYIKWRHDIVRYQITQIWQVNV